ncbi:MAG: hypothetical protein UT02_C0046G0001 [Parcubacteria group bacterium GW2011_GWC2_38_7]|nr:MAG: hypothetical protein UT02_C0046G0001 [Parcubacteria group bacterium GW2011_GWC2_38_7]
MGGEGLFHRLQEDRDELGRREAGDEPESQGSKERVVRTEVLQEVQVHGFPRCGELFCRDFRQVIISYKNVFVNHK